MTSAQDAIAEVTGHTPRPAIIVSDVETSSLVPNTRVRTWYGARTGAHYGVVTEAAWWNLDTDAHDSFVAHHSVDMVRKYGHPDALRVSNYEERLAGAEQDDGTALYRMHLELRGNTLAGTNPAFDAGHLTATYNRMPRTLAGHLLDPQPWRYRMLDLAAYAAGALGLDPHKVKGLADICEMLRVDPPDHTAAGDVRATGQCLRILLDAAGLEP